MSPLSFAYLLLTYIIYAIDLPYMNRLITI